MTIDQNGSIGLARRVNIIQGEQYVDNDPNVILTTILGSCVAVCLHDPVVALGGMNHFLLPAEQPGSVQTDHSGAMRYGANSMELLVNGLLRKGAQRNRLRAKLFGGARMLEGLTDVGSLNAAFAEHFLYEEGIAVVGGSLRGERGRRIQFWPASGRAQQIVFAVDQDAIFRTERSVAAPRVSPASGMLELF